jgi:histidinol phosphatase-like enzyme (inositol monophosphatase family)
MHPPEPGDCPGFETGEGMKTSDLTPYRAFLEELAEESGNFIRPLFASHEVAIEIKPDQTPVTEADRGAEELMRGMIAKRFPSHGVLGEEFGPDRTDSEFVWTLDPIDGTKAFATACPLFGTLIALLHDGEPVLGCIHQPVLRQLMIGDGAVTTLNGAPVAVGPPRPLDQATLLTSDTTTVPDYQSGQGWDALIRRTRMLRTWGDCYGYLLVASGWADIMCDPIMNPWDIAPVIPVIRGAGGMITDWQGLDPVNARSAVACHPALNADVVSVLNP